MADDLLGLHRSEKDRLLAGVCGGLAETWRVDPTVVRLGWAFLTIFTGGALGIILYAVAFFVLPVETAPASPETGADDAEQAAASRKKLYELFGWLLIGLGAVLLMDRVPVLHEFFAEFKRFLWPIVLIALGGLLIVYRDRSSEEK